MITTLTLQRPLADIIFKVNIFLGQLQMFMIYSSTQTNNVNDQAKWKRRCADSNRVYSGMKEVIY